ACRSTKLSASKKGMVRAQTIFISIWFTSATAKNGSAKTVTPNKSSAAALSQSSQCCRSRNHLRNYLISIAPELLTDRYLWVRAATTASENGYRKSAMICRPPSVRDGVSPKVRLYRREKSPIPEAVSKRSGFHGLAGVVGRSCTDHNLIRRMWR